MDTILFTRHLQQHAVFHVHVITRCVQGPFEYRGQGRRLGLHTSTIHSALMV